MDDMYCDTESTFGVLGIQKLVNILSMYKLDRLVGQVYHILEDNLLKAFSWKVADIESEKGYGSQTASGIYLDI